jgi:hypothetical protein
MNKLLTATIFIAIATVTLGITTTTHQVFATAVDGTRNPHDMDAPTANPHDANEPHGNPHDANGDASCWCWP